MATVIFPCTQNILCGSIRRNSKHLQRRLHPTPQIPNRTGMELHCARRRAREAKHSEREREILRSSRPKLRMTFGTHMFHSQCSDALAMRPREIRESDAGVVIGRPPSRPMRETRQETFSNDRRHCIRSKLWPRYQFGLDMVVCLFVCFWSLRTGHTRARENAVEIYRFLETEQRADDIWTAICTPL